MSIKTTITYNSSVIAELIDTQKLTLNTKNTYINGDIYTNFGCEAYEGDVSIVADCLSFTANAASSISMTITGTPTLNQSLKYSIDGQATWKKFTPGTTSISLQTNDVVYFKGNNPNGLSESTTTYYQFNMTGNISGGGNIMSLIDNGICDTLVIPNDYCFYSLFNGCTALISSPTLPATTLTSYCYASLFNSTHLVAAPTLPATTLASYCYDSMFASVYPLSTLPALPALTLAPYCYKNMFYGDSFETAPSLPATTLAEGCYRNIFDNCRQLINAPTLPALTLAKYCYHRMFQDCRALVVAPSLPATTLADNCYDCMFASCTALTTPPTTLTATTAAPYCCYGMFTSCTSLTTVTPILPATTLAGACYSGMFAYCTSLTKGPSLPATTSTDTSLCYSQMFYGCTSLVTIPYIRLTTSVMDGAEYWYMFQGCSSLEIWSSSGTGHTAAWRVPYSGVSAYQIDGTGAFSGCPGTRTDGDDLIVGYQSARTYYTQNTPV